MVPDSRRRVNRMELLQGAQEDLIGAPAESTTVEQPAVFGKRREELFAVGRDVNPVEVPAQRLQERLSVGRVTDLGRHDEGHSAAWSQQARCCDQKWSPR